MEYNLLCVKLIPARVGKWGWALPGLARAGVGEETEGN